MHDVGAGMAPDFLGHAAERFRQHEASPTGAGTGPGLSVDDAIAAAHGGRICSRGHHHAGPPAVGALAAVPCAIPTRARR